jgi:hypothetical protein
MEMLHQNLNRQPTHILMPSSGEVEHKQFTRACGALSSWSSCPIMLIINVNSQELNFYSLNVVASKLLGWQCRLPSITTGSIATLLTNPRFAVDTVSSDRF